MCDVCLGMSGCPVCTPEPNTEECVDCNGHGRQFFYQNPETGEVIEVDEESYNHLPMADKYTETCAKCDGEGVMIEETPSFEERRMMKKLGDPNLF